MAMLHDSLVSASTSSIGTTSCIGKNSSVCGLGPFSSSTLLPTQSSKGESEAGNIEQNRGRTNPFESYPVHVSRNDAISPLKSPIPNSLVSITCVSPSPVDYHKSPGSSKTSLAQRPLTPPSPIQRGACDCKFPISASIGTCDSCHKHLGSPSELSTRAQAPHNLPSPPMASFQPTQQAKPGDSASPSLSPSNTTASVVSNLNPLPPQHDAGVAIVPSSNSSASSAVEPSVKPPSPITPQGPVTSSANISSGSSQRKHSITSPNLPTPQQQNEIVLQALLGPGVSSWPYSDESLRTALQLRSEQEKTKQEFYRLELRKRSLDLLHEAIRYAVAPGDIPSLFSTPGLDSNAAISELDPQGISATGTRPKRASSSLSSGAPPSLPHNQTPTVPTSSPYGPSPVQAAAAAAAAGSFAASYPSMVSAVQKAPKPSTPSGSLISAPLIDRERYPAAHTHHQRNLSLPPQSELNPKKQQSTQSSLPSQTSPSLSATVSQAPPPPPPGASQVTSRGATSPFRPGHHHHASTSAIPTHTYSPVRTGGAASGTGVLHPPATIYGTSPNRNSWQSNQSPYFAPPSQISMTSSPSSPSNSLQHIIQFHHWQPNQQKPPASSLSSGSSPKRDTTGNNVFPVAPTSDFDQSNLKRRKSITAERAAGPERGERVESPTPSPAMISAAAHSSARRRGMGHSRHRSEASIIRSDSVPKLSNYSRPSTASLARQPQGAGGPALPPRTMEYESSGVNVLATVAMESERRSSLDPRRRSLTPSDPREPSPEHQPPIGTVLAAPPLSQHQSAQSVPRLNPPETAGGFQYPPSPTTSPTHARPIGIGIYPPSRPLSALSTTRSESIDAGDPRESRSHKHGVGFMISDSENSSIRSMSPSQAPSDR